MSIIWEINDSERNAFLIGDKMYRTFSHCLSRMRNQKTYWNVKCYALLAYFWPAVCTLQNREDVGHSSIYDRQLEYVVECQVYTPTFDI